MKMIKRIVFGIATILVAGVSYANYSEDFNAGIPAEWTEHDVIGGALGGTFATFSNPDSAYRIQAAQSPSPGLVGGARAMSVREDHTYADVTMTWDLVDWDDTAVQIVGGSARAKEIGIGTTDGYAFVFGPNSLGSGGIDLLRFDNENPTELTSTVSVTLNPTHDYRFVFTVEGPALTGQVYDLTTGAPEPVATISAVDAAYSEGVTGFLVANSATAGGHVGDATFDNVSAIDSTEPPVIIIPADLWIEATSSVVTVGSTNLPIGATNELWVTHDLTGNNWSNIPPAFVDVVSTNWTMSTSEPEALYQVRTTLPTAP